MRLRIVRGTWVGAAFALLAAGHAVAAPQASYAVKLMTPKTALAAARAALEHCRQQGRGHEVTVAVVDRAGLVQVLLRDRFAGAHTVDVVRNKAWTAASFKVGTARSRLKPKPANP